MPGMPIFSQRCMDNMQGIPVSPTSKKYLHMRTLLFLLMVIIASAASAYATDNDGHKNEKCENPEKPSSESKAAVKTTTVKPSRVEEYVWMLSREDNSAVEDGALENAVVDLYKWYLQNETRINSNDYLKGGGKSLVFPFKVDAKALQQYFQFIKNNFPGLNEDDLDKIKKPVANRKKYAPVTERDDMENPMSIATPK
jgi:hypothetical protein